MILNWQDLTEKINSNKTKHLVVENELKSLKAFDLSYFRGKFFLSTMVPKICLFINQHLTHYKLNTKRHPEMLLLGNQREYILPVLSHCMELSCLN